MKSSKNSSTNDLPDVTSQDIKDSNVDVKTDKLVDDQPLSSVVAKDLGDFSNNFNAMKINSTTKVSCFDI